MAPNTRMSETFAYNTKNAKIQGLSVQVGELFANLYQKHGEDSTETQNALEAYKSLRRLLPRQLNLYGQNRHIGSVAAHNATQGVN